jgi:hypothetical protein
MTAQLSAMQWICDWAQRQARAIANGYDCLAAWCSRQIELHRMYSRVGSITLNWGGAVNIMSTVPRRSARHLDSVSCLVIMVHITVLHIQHRFHMRET